MFLRLVLRPPKRRRSDGQRQVAHAISLLDAFARRLRIIADGSDRSREPRARELDRIGSRHRGEHHIFAERTRVGFVRRRARACRGRIGEPGGGYG